MSHRENMPFSDNAINTQLNQDLRSICNDLTTDFMRNPNATLNVLNSFGQGQQGMSEFPSSDSLFGTGSGGGGWNNWNQYEQLQQNARLPYMPDESSYYQPSYYQPIEQAPPPQPAPQQQSSDSGGGGSWWETALGIAAAFI
jgi:hypothetical protein